MADRKTIIDVTHVSTRTGNRADKSFSRKRCPIKPGEWIVRPYSKYRIEVILKAIKKGRIVERGDIAYGR